MTSNSLQHASPLRPSLGVWLIWAYAFWLITTPYESPRLEFLTTIRFERILAGVLAVYSLTNWGARWRDPKPTILFSCFFAISLISALLSPLSGSEGAQHWLENYWKLWLLFIFILLCVRTKEDVYLVMLGISAISLGYQLISWRDFLAGGSYVWQQGIKRMVGLWSGGGLGAANGFAFMALSTLPFCYCWFLRNRTSSRRILMIGGIALSIASMVFSGTRGAIVVGLAVAFGGVLIVSSRRFHYLILAFMTAFGAYLIAPEEIRSRYTTQLFPMDFSDDATDQYEELASNSAQGRIDGLVDGYLLFLERPLLGWGPGTSATARLSLDKENARESALQLHSLYGQVLAETGIGGTILFAWLTWYFVVSLVRMFRESTGMSRSLSAILLIAFAINLLYGFVSHTLFGYYWIFLFGLSAVLISEERYELQEGDSIALNQ